MMKYDDEDYAYEQWRQAKIERDWGNVPAKLSPQIHQKVGTVIPFSRTVDRDPNPRIPLSTPCNSYPSVQKWELVSWALLVGFWAMLVIAYNMGWLS